ncbi:MAG: Hsp20/alpha crystallin family protein [Candidatus Saccharibacteria bacterium]|nr:Hsp20/alpha crystallin family protein [Candidatus Saccharibacteria bacterium]
MFFDNLFDDVFEPFFNNDFFASRSPHRHMIGSGQKKDLGMMNLMRTDVKENDKNYELAIDLPGYTKDEVKAKLDNGQLTISAEKTVDNTDKDGKFLRKERYSGSITRSWYVGEDLKQSDLKANFKDGVLTITIPKIEPKKELPDTDKYISIEG